MTPAGSPVWVVRCDDYQTDHKTRDAAERRLADIERGGHCPLPHEIREVDSAAPIVPGINPVPPAPGEFGAHLGSHVWTNRAELLWECDDDCPHPSHEDEP